MIPLSLYIHIPWCTRKCPYCDFNSYENIHQELPERDYLNALLADLDEVLPQVQCRPIQSIFIGGGTPNCLSPAFYDQLLSALHKRLEIAANSEITMEANPGGAYWDTLSAYRKLGINRLSIGVQSFAADKLQVLGRIHDAKQAMQAVEIAHAADFAEINIDLMYGLPRQTVQEAIKDIQIALLLEPSHLSWYHLTIERNTPFYRNPPTMLPSDEVTCAMEDEVNHLLKQAQFYRYEVSAFSKPGAQCQHNRNYWEFGDYIGIGAGAHSKLSDSKQRSIKRSWKKRTPRHYMGSTQSFVADSYTLSVDDRIVEFMLGGLRLIQGFDTTLFEAHTYLSSSDIAEKIQMAQAQHLLIQSQGRITPTPIGIRFLNDLIGLFID